MRRGLHHLKWYDFRPAIKNHTITKEMHNVFLTGFDSEVSYDDLRVKIIPSDVTPAAVEIEDADWASILDLNPGVLDIIAKGDDIEDIPEYHNRSTSGYVGHPHNRGERRFVEKRSCRHKCNYLFQQYWFETRAVIKIDSHDDPILNKDGKEIHISYKEFMHDNNVRGILKWVHWKRVDPWWYWDQF